MATIRLLTFILVTVPMLLLCMVLRALGEPTKGLLDQASPFVVRLYRGIYDWADSI